MRKNSEKIMAMDLIHKYHLCGHYIILDIPSGGVFSVDKLTYELLDLLTPPFFPRLSSDIYNKLSEYAPPFSPRLSSDIYNKLSEYAPSEIDEAYSEICELAEKGLLFTQEETPDISGIAKNAPVKALCLHIAHDCNLKCEYCFAAKGDFGHGRELMSEKIGFAAIDFLIANSADRINLEVDFFGGEPLMNYDVVKSIVKYARNLEKKHNKNFRFTLTTNGLLLDDEITRHINKEMSNVVLSLDGRREINDRIRPCINGKGSYDVIVPKFKKLVSERLCVKNDFQYSDYYIRGTFTKHNLDFCNDVLHINDLGFEQISIEPVVGDFSQDYQFGEEDLPTIFDEYEKLAFELIKRKKAGKHINFFHFMLDLSGGPCLLKRLRGCGSGSEYLAITPNGDFYPCHQFVRMSEWKMGNVLTGDIDKNKRKIFDKTSIYDKSDCGKCWAKYYCSGGCNANNYQFEGDILKPHKISCELEKKRLECAIMMKVIV